MTPSFLWGAATSSHQVEGYNDRNEWWAWETAGRVKEVSGAACDHYARFREDIDLLSHLGHNAHRFSLEWSRLQPEENRWDEKAFRHYEEVLQALRARNIEPVVTLHHFTHPRWFMAKGGWLNEGAVSDFVRYVERVTQAYGRYVRFWVTINEPLIYIYHGYLRGLWPPGSCSYEDSLRVLRRMIRAHLESYRVIHCYYADVLQGPVWVSIAKHLFSYSPCRPASGLDHAAAFLRDWFFNFLLLDALRSGILFFPGVFCEKLPNRNALDFIGINYYTRHFVRFAGLSGEGVMGSICEGEHHRGRNREKNSLGWPVFPEGLGVFLKRLRRYHLPVMICENGICTEDDVQRERFIRDHIRQVGEAKRRGIPIWGYFYWSLLDNFEWAHGFGPRFGIAEVDDKSFARKIRRSAYVLSECCRQL